MENTAERDKRVIEILSEARQRSPAERDSYLRQACDTDPQLREEVAETLNWEDRMGSFLLQPLIARTILGSPFEIGQLIDHRFEILRVIGEGGMGIVYEAVDRKRNHRIAIKAAKPGFQRLLSPELEGALEVRHNNICLVNQIHTTQTDCGEVDFLTMEFLDGETLSSYIFGKGKLDLKESLVITRQLCSALSEAHRSGIVHGDLKSSNIILCKEDPGGLRAVITDFGLASGANRPAGSVGGTPPYMAPELWRGEKTSKATDMYALGVILYEMVTGHLPVECKSREAPPSRTIDPPGTRCEELDAPWDRVILDCLNESPGTRPSDAMQVIGRLDKKPLRKAPLIAVALVAIAALIPPIRERAMDLFMPAHVRLAILPFRGPTDATVIGEGALQDVSDRLRHLPSARRTLVVITPESELRNSVQTAQQARDVLHATHALQTSLYREGNDYVAKGSVIDLETQDHLRDFSTRYSQATIGAFPSALAGQVSLALHLPTAAAPEVLSAEATAPYDKGLYLLRTDEQTFENAIGFFREAARLDSRSPLPPAALVEAQLTKYDVTRNHDCLDEARRALQEAESLNPDSARVRLAGGLLNRKAGQYQQALEDYRRVQELEPRNIEALLEIASVYFAVSMPDKAIETYRQAVALDPGYYKSHEQLGAFYYFRGEYPMAVEQFQAAIDRAPGRFVAHSNLGAALMDLGNYEEAEKVLMESLKLRETAPALNNLGAIRAYQRRDVEAVEYYARAVAMDPNDYVNIENLADSYRRLGRMGAARTAYRTAMNLALRDLAENPSLGYPRAFVAHCAARLGDRRRAQAEIGQALKSSPGDKGVIRNAVLTYNVLGQNDRAITVLGRASPAILQELRRHPDLADFCRNPRFQQLVATIENGGK